MEKVYRDLADRENEADDLRSQLIAKDNQIAKEQTDVSSLQS
jgi:hypothetical protein